MSRARLAWVAVVGFCIFHGAARSAPLMGVTRIGPETSACVTFRQEVRVGERLLIVLFAPPRVVDGVVNERNEGSCNPNIEQPGIGYEMTLRHSIGQENELGIAVLDPSAQAVYADGEFVMNTKGATTPLSFRTCSSNEGIHLSTWRGNRRTWHEYWYLDQDLEPTCTDEEARE